MVWGFVIGLSAAASALTVYALWPWAAGRQSKFVYQALIAGLAFAILIGPGIVFYWSKPKVKPAVDISGLLQGDNGKKFLWDGPLVAGGNASHQADTSLETVTARLAKKLETQPDNVNGWVLLARSYVAMGDMEKARKIFNDSMAKWPKNVEVKVAYGEMLMAAANGVATPDARKAFEAAVAGDPKHIRAQYDLALADRQQGKDRAAYDRWLRLAQTAPADAPWLPEVTARLRETAVKLGLDVPDIAKSSPPSPVSVMPNPSAEQMREAMKMSPADREAFIRNMVEGLANKLKRNPNDLQGWLRLGRSYGVLGDWEKAKTTYRDGLKAFPGNPALTEALARIPQPGAR